MRTLAVVPIKTLSSAKQRLSGALATGARASLAQAMFSDVLASLRRSHEVEAIAVVTADVVANAVAHGEQVTVLPDDRQEGQSAAALIGIRYAAAAGYQRVVLVPGDTPLLDAIELDELLVRCEADPVAVGVVPDRHRTGTNALVLCPPSVLEPSFGPGSFNRHMNHAKGAGLSHRAEHVPSLEHDVDTPEDLAALSDALEGRRTIAPRTRGALRQLERSGVLVS
jgi:2-phospho-L-lactate/phosphoenolpyruvate guanylyltransferase